MIVKATSKWAIYCPDHGLFFVTEREYRAQRFRCRVAGCPVICDPESLLLDLATMGGCKFCGKKVDNSEFVYLPKLGAIYCNFACLNCCVRNCACRGCRKLARFVVYLDVSGKQIFVPIALCKIHRIMVEGEGFWEQLVRMLQSLKYTVPEKRCCRIRLRKY